MQCKTIYFTGWLCQEQVHLLRRGHRGQLHHPRHPRSSLPLPHRSRPQDTSFYMQYVSMYMYIKVATRDINFGILIPQKIELELP